MWSTDKRTVKFTYVTEWNNGHRCPSNVACIHVGLDLGLFLQPGRIQLPKQSKHFSQKVPLSEGCMAVIMGGKQAGI